MKSIHELVEKEFRDFFIEKSIFVCQKIKNISKEGSEPIDSPRLRNTENGNGEKKRKLTTIFLFYLICETKIKFPSLLSWLYNNVGKF